MSEKTSIGQTRRMAMRCRDDRIDILMDLTPHMANGRPPVLARNVEAVFREIWQRSCRERSR